MSVSEEVVIDLWVSLGVILGKAYEELLLDPEVVIVIGMGDPPLYDGYVGSS